MGIFIVLVVIIVIAIGLYFIIDKRNDYYSIDEPMQVTCVIVAVIFGIILLIATFTACAENMFMRSTLIKKQEKYTSIIREIETENYKDKLGLEDKAIIEKIEEWNVYVKSGKYYSNSFWTSALYPKKIYDNLETISYDLIEKREKGFYSETIIIDYKDLEKLEE